MLKSLKLTMAAIVAVGLLSVCTDGEAYALEPAQITESQRADQQMPNADIPLEINPVCSDALAKTSKWTVTNKNVTEIELEWNNLDNDLSGTFQAAPGSSTLVTGYNPTDPNNTTEFTYSGNTSSTNAQVAPCAVTDPEPTPECTDGSIQDNLVFAYLSPNVVTLQTKDGALLCDDVTVYFSSYIMPDNYDGNGFENNPTAYPQSIFSSTHMVLEKGTTGFSTFTIELPPTCKNVQTDLYYGPEITEVGPNGHGTQNIDSHIYESTGSCMPECEPDDGDEDPTIPPVTPPTPGMGSAGGTPVAPSAPVKPVRTAELPAMLPETGGGSSYQSLLLAFALAFVTYVVVYYTQPKRSELTSTN